MIDSNPDPGAVNASITGARELDPQQLRTYFVLTEAVSLLQYRVEQQLRAQGGLGYVQFQLLARLAEAGGPLTMTQLADGVVYSRSGLTYQAGLLQKAGLITRAPSPDDERATLVTITDSGLAVIARILPGHIEVIRSLLLEPLSEDDLEHLGDIMTRVRDHMRAEPPRSAAARKHRSHPAQLSHGKQDGAGRTGDRRQPRARSRAGTRAVPATRRSRRGVPGGT